MLYFFNHPVFTIIGTLTTLLSMLAILYVFICWIIGITPVVFRIGISLWKREIAVFSSEEQFKIIRDMLVDSKIFSVKNIICINQENIEKAKNITVFLVEWETFNNRIDEIFMCRPTHQTPIVIYAKPGSIPQDKMSDIANRTNTIVVNFKGRLLNDILVSMVTSSYKGR
jgi:hypothetical protein